MYWVKSGCKLKGESILAKHNNNVISLILGCMTTYYWGVLIAVVVRINTSWDSNYFKQLYLFTVIYANLTMTALFALVVLILAWQVFDQQADVLGQVFDERAQSQVIIKPVPTDEWLQRQQAWADIDSEVSE